MKRQIKILVIFMFLFSGLSAQLSAFTHAYSVKEAGARVADRIGTGFSKVKSKVGRAFSGSKKSRKSSGSLGKARSTMQQAFNMEFLSSLPVIFWKKSFNTMFNYTNNTIDNMKIQHGEELVTRDDFQNDKALHIKKSAELALHVKSLFGSSVFAYGVTLVVGAAKEFIDGSFLNPNGSRSWEDFYADMVGASAVFGKKSFDKKLNKYMKSFLKEGRVVNYVGENSGDAEQRADYVTSSSFSPVLQSQGRGDSVSRDEAGSRLEKQRLTQEYYEAVRSGDAELVRRIAEQLKKLK